MVHRRRRTGASRAEAGQSACAATDAFSLLREHEVAPAFVAAMRGASDIMIAVPFWGRGAVERLALRKGRPARIVCNLDHPGCNPSVIEALLDRKFKVRTNRRLHAKIYVTSDVAIVGSSNASSNGLTAESEEALGWIEANVLSRDPALVEATTKLFIEIWDDRANTLPVTRKAIAAAKEARAALPPLLFDLPRGTSLFDAARKNPEAFASVYVAAYSRALDDDAARDLRKLRKAALAPATPDVPDFRKAWGYQFEDVFADAWLIDIDCRKPRAPRYRGCARATGFATRYDDAIAMTYAVPGMIRIGGRSFPLRRAEQAMLFAASGKIMKRGNDRLVPLAVALELVG